MTLLCLPQSVCRVILPCIRVSDQGLPMHATSALVLLLNSSSSNM